MARPVVLVYQEFATVTTTPDTPDLNALIAGPAYWIKDYLDDKGSVADGLYMGAYGTEDEDNPYTPPAALTISEPPKNATGAILDADSVSVYLDECRVLMAEDKTGVSGAVISSTSPAVPHNRIDCAACSAGFLAEFGNLAINDYVIVQNPGGGSDLKKRILVLDATNKYIYTNTNFTVGHDTNKMKIRVERKVQDVLVGDAFVYVSGNATTLDAGVTTTLTGETSPRAVTYARAWMEYRSLRQDLCDVETVSSETDITTNIGKIDARNPLAGTLAAALKNTTTPIQYFGVTSDDASGHSECIEILEGRKDVYAVVPLTTDKSILETYETQFTQLASVDHAETTGIPQRFRVVLGAQELPTSAVVSPTDSAEYETGSHYTVTGAVANTPIITADPINVICDPAATFVTDGVRAGDELVILDTGRAGTYTIAAVYDETRLRLTDPIAAGTAAITYYIMRDAGTLIADTTFTGGTSAIVPDNNLATATPDIVGGVSQEGMVVRITESTPTNDLIGDWYVTHSTAVTPAVWSVLASTQNAPTNPWAAGSTAIHASLYAPVCGSGVVARAVTSRRCYRIIKCTDATFKTDGVKAADILETTIPPGGTDYTTHSSHVVAYIPNENDVVLAANEDVETTVANTPDTGTLHFRVSRTMSKDDQVTELVAIAQSFASRRIALMWPDSIVVSGLVDGSKTRVTPSTPVAADPQPGYYIGAIVGGLTSGLPPHQGFTNLGVAGIDTLYHSTRYFSDTQLTTLSDGGWFLYVQDTPNTLPYCLHQLTTDTSALETGEYSVVKNFDYVAMFFQDILFDFLGQYNVTQETLGLLRQALDTGIDLLKLRRYAKIGAPLTSAEITSVAQHETIADRVEINMNIGLPKPLNRIGLHLVSV